MEIGTRLRQFRESIGLTREQFFERYGIPVSSQAGYELDKRDPGSDALAAYARAGADISRILTSGDSYSAPGEARQLVAQESPPAVIDLAILQQVIDFFFRWIDEHQTRIDRSKFAGIIAVLYRISATSGKVDKAELEQVLALAA